MVGHVSTIIHLHTVESEYVIRSPYRSANKEYIIFGHRVDNFNLMADIKFKAMILFVKAKYDKLKK